MIWIMDTWELWQQTAARGFYIWGYFENGPWRAPLRGRAEGNPYGNTMRIFWNLNCPQTIFEHKCKELTPNAEEWIVGLYGLSRGHLSLHFGRWYPFGEEWREIYIGFGNFDILDFIDIDHQYSPIGIVPGNVWTLCKEASRRTTAIVHHKQTAWR